MREPQNHSISTSLMTAFDMPRYFSKRFHLGCRTCRARSQFVALRKTFVEGATGDAGATYDTVPVHLQKEVLRKPNACSIKPPIIVHGVMQWRCRLHHKTPSRKGQSGAAIRCAYRFCGSPAGVWASTPRRQGRHSQSTANAALRRENGPVPLTPPNSPPPHQYRAPGRGTARPSPSTAHPTRRRAPRRPVRC